MPAGLRKCQGKKKDPRALPNPPPPPPHSIFSYVNSHFPPEQTHFRRLRPATLHTAPPTFFFFFPYYSRLLSQRYLAAVRGNEKHSAPAGVCHYDRAPFISRRLPRVTRWKLGRGERLRQRLAPSLVNVCRCRGNKRQPATVLSQIKALICIYGKHRFSLNGRTPEGRGSSQSAPASERSRISTQNHQKFLPLDEFSFEFSANPGGSF